MARLTKVRVDSVIVGDNYTSLNITSLDADFPGSFDKKFSLLKYNPETQANDIEDGTHAQATQDTIAKYLNSSYEELAMVEGTELDVYIDEDNFNIYFEDIKFYSKFDKKLLGKTLKGCTVTAINYEPTKNIQLVVDYEGDEYAIYYRFEAKVGNEYVLKPKKRKSAIERFLNEFEITSMDEIDSQIGKEVYVKVEETSGNVFGSVAAVL